MLAVPALLTFALERRLTFVTDHPCALGNGFLDILSLTLDSGGALLCLGLLGLFQRISWTFLAAAMVTIVANFINTKLSAAAVASTVHSHADLLLNSGDISLEGWGPFANFQGHIVFREQGPDLLFLDLCMFCRGQDCFRSDGRGDRLCTSSFL